ncbi:MAG TPA: TIGR04282 family arsenosugar biosynthesis glycosyltransferase [Candidatus Eisenbacteria bacterium]
MNHIAVFARWPEPGRVKTRLTPALTPALACDLHRAMLDDALAAAAAAPADARVLCWADAPAGHAAFVPPPGFEERDQGPGDLGARLERAFGSMLRGPDDHAVIIGADCPDLGGEAIAKAFAALGRRDLVLGPARDGGYYLIGLACKVTGLFHDIAWGSDRVLTQTLEHARTLGLEVERLEALDDLDTPEDLVNWSARSCIQGSSHAPRTRAALAALGLIPAP